MQSLTCRSPLLIVEDVLFHCQQAVEKALKAFLTWHDRPFGKTHDLQRLGLRCPRVDPGLNCIDLLHPQWYTCPNPDRLDRKWGHSNATGHNHRGHDALSCMQSRWLLNYD